MLYDRLEGKKDLLLQLYVIMQNAVIASLTDEATDAVHDPDSDVRVRKKAVWQNR